MAGLDTQNLPITDKQLEGLEAVLSDLQGNILRSHGRDYSVHIFLRFLDRDKAKEWIAKIAHERLTSAQKQIEEAKRYDGGRGPSGEVFWGFFLSAHGYEYLELPNLPLLDAAFRQGMAKRQASANALLQQSVETLPTLNDPLQETWDKGYHGAIDAMLLLADDQRQNLPWEEREGQQLPREEQLRALEDYLGKLGVGMQEAAEVCAIEYGRVLRRTQTKESFEHFGYADGRSQPLFFQKDVDQEAGKEGLDRWSPEAGPSLVLVKDPVGTLYNQGNPAYGSYLVFRKLKQDVRGFDDYLRQVETILNLQGHDQHRAEALVMGRFRDGTPVILQPTPGQHDPVPNNFDFTHDPQGVRCPFQAHIRKMNPRGERDRSIRGAVATAVRRLALETDPTARARIQSDLDTTLKRLGIEEQEKRDGIQNTRDDRYERRRRIARRSVPYGKQEDPEVGLLFMCYQRDICQQFEFLQASWANNKDFPASGTGPDAIIGRPIAGTPAFRHNWPRRWNAKRGEHEDLNFQSFITLKGGEYFFAPSLPLLRNITAIGASSVGG